MINTSVPLLYVLNTFAFKRVDSFARSYFNRSYFIETWPHNLKRVVFKDVQFCKFRIQLDILFKFN